MSDNQENESDPKADIRAKWRKWAQDKRDRMSPEQLAEARAKAKERRAARLATPEGRERHREQDRRWRAANPDRIARHREKEREQKRLKREAERAARLLDPAYLEKQAARALRSQESAREACKRYYQNRRARLASDPEAFAAYREKQKQYRKNKAARLMADPERRAAYLERARLRDALRVKKQKVQLTDQEREEAARRRREQRAKAKRLLNAKKRAEREARKAEEKKTASEEIIRRPIPVRKMGRLTALLKWHGR